jgi:hypothetical protein
MRNILYVMAFHAVDGSVAAPRARRSASDAGCLEPVEKVVTQSAGARVSGLGRCFTERPRLTLDAASRARNGRDHRAIASECRSRNSSHSWGLLCAVVVTFPPARSTSTREVAMNPSVSDRQMG